MFSNQVSSCPSASALGIWINPGLIKGRAVVLGLSLRIEADLRPSLTIWGHVISVFVMLLKLKKKRFYHNTFQNKLKPTILSILLKFFVFNLKTFLLCMSNTHRHTHQVPAHRDQVSLTVTGSHLQVGSAVPAAGCHGLWDSRHPIVCKSMR